MSDTEKKVKKQDENQQDVKESKKNKNKEKSDDKKDKESKKSKKKESQDVTLDVNDINDNNDKIEPEKDDDEEEIIDFTVKPKYIPGMKMPEPEPDAPPIPTSKYRHYADCFKKTFPDLNLSEFRNEHGFDPVLYKKDPQAHQKYHDHPNWIKIKQIFDDDQAETRKAKEEYQKKYPKKFQLKTLTTMRKRYESAENKKNSDAQPIKKRKRNSNDTDQEEQTSRIIKSLHYLPDEVGAALSHLERSVNQNNLELVAHITATITKNQEEFGRFEKTVHEFYKTLNKTSMEMS